MATETRKNRLTLKGVTLICRNFAGKEKTDKKGHIVNSEGSRNFLCKIPENIDIDALIEDHWNVKPFGSDDPCYVIPVKVRFDKFPPKICLVTGDKGNYKKVLMYEEDVHNIDTMEISNVDVVLSQSFYDVRGVQGYCSYLKTMYITPVEDELDAEYDDIMSDEIPFD